MTTWVNSPDPLIHPQGLTISLKLRSRVRSSYSLLVPVWTIWTCSWWDDGCSLGGRGLLGQYVMSQEVLNWIYVWRTGGKVNSVNVSIIQDLPTPSNHRRLNIVMKRQEQSSNLRCCPSTTLRGEQGCLQQLKQNKPPARAFLLCPQMLLPKVRPPRRHVQLLDLCSVKQGFILEKRRKEKQLCAII